MQRNRRVIDNLPSESDIEYMFDVFLEDITPYITDEEKVTEKINYLKDDVKDSFQQAYDVFDTLDELKDVLEEL